METQIWRAVANYQISVTNPGLSDFKDTLQCELEQEPSWLPGQGLAKGQHTW